MRNLAAKLKASIKKSYSDARRRCAVLSKASIPYQAHTGNDQSGYHSVLLFCAQILMKIIKAKIKVNF